MSYAILLGFIMGLFGSNIKKIILELKKVSEYYSNDLSNEIHESFEDLKSEYDESSSAVPDFLEFADELKPRLSPQEQLKLEAITTRLSKLNQSARKGVDAMYDLARNQRKLTTENLRHYEEYEV